MSLASFFARELAKLDQHAHFLTPLMPRLIPPPASISPKYVNCPTSPGETMDN